MTTGLSLEKLAQVIHADKQRTFAQERFARQVALAQGRAHQEPNATALWTAIKQRSFRQLVVTLAVRPLRLTVQWG